jgi:type III pantothenate kinase
MRLAIDVGNSDTKFGFHLNGQWAGVWRRPTALVEDPQELADWLASTASGAGLPMEIEAVACVSVVPEKDAVIQGVAPLISGKEAVFLRPLEVTGLKLLYNPPESIGADRIANILGALKQYQAPLIVVDFGTATTLEVCSEEGFIGGAILPGVKLQLESLGSGTSKLPEIEPIPMERAIGQDTRESILSGVVLGHVAAIEGLIARTQSELTKPATVLGTGGFAHLFMGATQGIQHYVPQLTLEGALSILPA